MLQLQTSLGRLVDDYLAATRAAGASLKTIRFSYRFPLREVFLPWAAEQGIAGPVQLDYPWPPFCVDRPRETSFPVNQERSLSPATET